jgi:hypothetical protein
VTALTPTLEVATVYNLTIADLHTYYVSPERDRDIGTAILVHNAKAPGGCALPAPSPASKKVHGNSANSSRTTYLYRLTDTYTGQYLKTGISSNTARRYTRAFMKDKRLDPMSSGSGREMLNLERYIVERDPGPLDFEPWAGTTPWTLP